MDVEHDLAAGQPRDQPGEHQKVRKVVRVDDVELTFEQQAQARGRCRQEEAEVRADIGQPALPPGTCTSRPLSWTPSST